MKERNKYKVEDRRNSKMEMTKQRTIRKRKKRFNFGFLGLKGIHNNIER
jgi:hypothetical protein